MEHLQRVWLASRERLPFWTPGSVLPFWGLAYAPIVETMASFTELAVTFDLEYPSVLSILPQVRAQGFKTRMYPLYPQRDRKRRLNGGGVSESPYKKVGPVSVLGRAR